MFKETKSELERLEKALLEEDWDEEPEEEAEEVPAQPTGYANFANGYRIYNTDKTDEELEQFSDRVYEAESGSGTGLWIGALVICLIVLALLGSWMLRYLGVW